MVRNVHVEVLRCISKKKRRERGMWLTSTQWLPEVCQPQTVNRWSVHVLSVVAKRSVSTDSAVVWMNAVLDASYFALSLNFYVKTASLTSVLNLAHVSTSPTQIHMPYIFSLSTVDVHTHAHSIERIHLTSTPMPRRWKSGTADTTPDTHGQIQCTNSKTHMQASNSVRVSDSLVTFMRAATQRNWL